MVFLFTTPSPTHKTIVDQQADSAIAEQMLRSSGDETAQDNPDNPRCHQMSPNCHKITQRGRLHEPSFNLRMTFYVKYIQGRLAKRYCEKLIKCNKVLARIIQTKRLSFK